jgi:peptidase E
MKRLILMGGRPWFAADKGKRFTESLFRYAPKEVKVAFCIFAQPEIDWKETRDWNTSMFDAFKAERTILYQTMTETNFAEVSAWADIIYVPGGDTNLLMDRLATCGDIASLWDGKVVAGSSAGADFMCEGFIYLQEKSYGRGLNWVKATMIPHWRSPDWEGYTSSDWDQMERKSLQEAPGTPVLCVPESEFVEFIVE